MTTKVYEGLVETRISTIDLNNFLISKRKANDKKFIRKLTLIHSPAFLEIINLKTIFCYSPNLSELIIVHS